MVEVWCACVTALSLGTKVEIIMVWFYCTTFLAASGVARYQERLDIDVFWHFSFYLFAPATYIIQTHRCCQSISTAHTENCCLSRGFLFSKKALLVELLLLFINSGTGNVKGLVKT